MKGATMQAEERTRYAITSVQAATYLDVSLGHLYNMISTGRGPRHVKYGGQLRFRTADLDGWVAARCEVVDPGDPSSD